ncbi:MAG: PAS domain S-box protein [Syntrophomonadaceae bacterium]|nr:PAS domain S-box protein [Syntrophomonadaceae bacterium]
MNRLDKKYEQKTYDTLELAHFISMFILGLGLVLSNDFTGDIFPAYGLRGYIIAVFVGVVIVSIYFNTYIMKDNEYSLFNNIVYIVILMAVTIVAIFLSRHDSTFFSLALILPVLFAASSLGLRGGLITAIACVIIQISHQKIIYPAMPVANIIESNLVFIGIILVTGWYIGNTVEMERLSRNALKNNIKSLYRLTCAVEQSPSLVMITDKNGIIEYVNKKFGDITGYQRADAQGKPMYFLNPAYMQEIEDILKKVAETNEWSGEFESIRKDGEVISEMVSIIPIFDNEQLTSYLRVSEDITSDKEIEKEMARVDRLHMVGEIAAGIGHEIRNPMTTVRGFLQLMGTREEFKQEGELFNLMIEELDRANSIITEFLNMAKSKIVEKTLLNLNDIIISMEPLLRSAALKEGMELKILLGEIPDMLMDQGEIRQVILNLVRNGIEAMDTKCILTIKTYVEEDEVVLAVQDEGKGIDPAIADKIGTPFFTTKDSGTGLGLAICYSIANRHNAKIDIDTGPNGTGFLVRFMNANPS